MMDSFNADGHMDDLERVHEVTITRGTYNLLGECSCGEYSVSTSGIAIHKWERDHKKAEQDESDEEVTYTGHDGRRYGADGAKTTYTVHYRTQYMPAKATPRTKTFSSLGLANTWIRNYGVYVLGITEK